MFSNPENVCMCPLIFAPRFIDLNIYSPDLSGRPLASSSPPPSIPHVQTYTYHLAPMRDSSFSFYHTSETSGPSCSELISSGGDGTGSNGSGGQRAAASAFEVRNAVLAAHN